MKLPETIGQWTKFSRGAMLAKVSAMYRQESTKLVSQMLTIGYADPDVSPTIFAGGAVGAKTVSGNFECVENQDASRGHTCYAKLADGWLVLAGGDMSESELASFSQKFLDGLS